MRFLLRRAMMMAIICGGVSNTLYARRPRSSTSLAAVRNVIAYFWGSTYADNIAVDIDSKSLITIPRELQRLKSMDLYHIRSPYQIGPSCGWYSIGNAYALSECLQKRKKFSYYDIQRLVDSSYLQRIKKQEQELSVMVHSHHILEGLFSHEKYFIAHRFGIMEHAYIIDVTSDEMLWVHGVAQSACSSITFKKLKRMMMTHRNGHVHILLGIPASIDTNHAVLLTLVKPEKNKLILMYMDSNNELLSVDYTSEGWVYPQHVRSFIKALDAA